MTGVVEVRARRPDDLDALVAALEQVHRADGYPSRWPRDPAAWLTPRGMLAAWVAVTGGSLAGHIALARHELAVPVTRELAELVTRELGEPVRRELGEPVRHEFAEQARHELAEQAGHELGEPARGLEVTRLFVPPAARRGGAATRLLRAAAERAAREQAGLWLEVTAGSAPAIAFYLRHGWRFAGSAAASWTTASGERPVVRRYLAPESPGTGKACAG